MRLPSLIHAATALALSLPVVARAADGITVTDALSRATPAGAPTGVGYMTITNAGDAGDRLVSASSPDSAKKITSRSSTAPVRFSQRKLMSVAVRTGLSSTEPRPQT